MNARILMGLSLVCLVASPFAVWFAYEPVRVLAPEWAGVSCVSDRVCTDEIAREAEAVELYDAAYAFVVASVGNIEGEPRVIFCATQACFESFGFNKAAAHTVGVSGIVVSPRGWKDYYVRHEMIHHLQAERLGVIRQWRMPGWFTEGMAYVLGQDPRPVLSEPWQGYRSEFRRWYRSVGKNNLWAAAKELRLRGFVEFIYGIARIAPELRY